mgnify:CR=1 FL=1
MVVAVRVGVSVLVRTSKKGGSGIYFYVPKDHAETFGIGPGDKVEIRIVRVFKNVPEKKSKVVDLS